jgi:hypothetical protein
MKIATISFAPWVFYFFEKGVQKQRLIYFLTTSMVLAFQFFHTHWQIAFYTCLALAAYGIFRLLPIAWRSWFIDRREVARLVNLQLIMVLFFLSTVAISLVPLANWSRESNRGVASGANEGKGGLQVEEAMSWSLPPEELVSFVIPGFFGFSRQEGGENPTSIASYYWGRMAFTQTSDYMGLLPWLLVPLPLIFLRNRYTWLATGLLGGALLFSMGKYTPFYWALYEYFPGINHFRVPKMMMFVAVFALAILAAQGFDLLRDAEVRARSGFRRYLWGVGLLPVFLLVLLMTLITAEGFWTNLFFEQLMQPTRYEQGMGLLQQRWENLVAETGLATLVTALHAGAILAIYRWGWRRPLVIALFILLLVDVWRINDKFLFLVPEPTTSRGVKTPLIDYLAEHGSLQSRVLPMDGSDPMYYVNNNIPVMFTSNAVQQRRWQEFLDNFSLASAMPDIMNVRYLVLSRMQYAELVKSVGFRYRPVWNSADGQQLIVENVSVLPKAWLVSSVAISLSPAQTLGILQHPAFRPASVGIVETPPPFAMAYPGKGGAAGSVAVRSYGANSIALDASVTTNALLVLGDKYYKGWNVTVDGESERIIPVDHVLRGVYLPPGEHQVEFVFDPLPFKIGKYLTLASFAFFLFFLSREGWLRWRMARG